MPTRKFRAFYIRISQQTANFRPTQQAMFSF